VACSSPIHKTFLTLSGTEVGKLPRGLPDFTKSIAPQPKEPGPILIGSKVDPELVQLDVDDKVAIDKWKRLVISQYDYAHFEEKLAWNPLAGHFWHHFDVEPVKERDIYHEGVTFAESLASIPPGAYIYTHQQFRYGLFQHKMRIPLPASGVLFSFGMFDIHITEFASPVSRVSNVFFRVTDTAFLAVVEGFGAKNEFDITASLPPDADAALHTYEIKIFDDFVAFYVDNDLVATDFADGVVKRFSQRRCLTSLVIKNEGTDGTGYADLIVAQPEVFAQKAPRLFLRDRFIEFADTDYTFYGYSCIIDRAIVRNPGVLHADVTLKDRDSPAVTVWHDTVPAGATRVVELGFPFKYGLVGRSTQGGIVLHFVGTFL